MDEALLREKQIIRLGWIEFERRHLVELGVTLATAAVIAVVVFLVVVYLAGNEGCIDSRRDLQAICREAVRPLIRNRTARYASIAACMVQVLALLLSGVVRSPSLFPNTLAVAVPATNRPILVVDTRIPKHVLRLVALAMAVASVAYNSTEVSPLVWVAAVLLAADFAVNR